MEILDIAKKCFSDEIEELQKLSFSLDNTFEKIVHKIYNTSGKVIIIGIGKSGIIGKKIAATFMSTGTPAAFLNAAEGLHGDLGMIEKNDTVIIISNSGNSPETLELIPSLKIIGCYIIAFTGNLTSKLAQESDINLFVGVSKEACPMNVAPTSSTTALLVIGDAIAICLIHMKNFNKNIFKIFHPGGALGKRLSVNLLEIMLPLEKIGIVSEENSILEILNKLNEYNIGAVCVCNATNELLGIITDGDLKRILIQNQNFFQLKAKDVMTKYPKFIAKDTEIFTILSIMENKENLITFLPVLEDKKLIGGIRIHDILNL